MQKVLEELHQIPSYETRDSKKTLRWLLRYWKTYH